MPQLTPQRLRALVAVLVAALGLTFAVAVDLDGDGHDDVNITISSPEPGAHPVELGPAGQAVLQDMQLSPAALEHVHTAREPGDVAPAVARANQKTIDEQTYDASGIVTGAAGRPARIQCLTHNHGLLRPVSQIGLGVVHTSEGPNIRGLADINGLCAWARTQKLSWTWHVDDEGNSATVLPLTATPWSQFRWNPWACSIEHVGFASRAAAEWTSAQLRESARLMAQCFKLAGIPIRWGKVAGTACGQQMRIVQTGAISHEELGCNGGSHHDPGHNFPRARYLDLMRGAVGLSTKKVNAAKRACSILQWHRKQAHDHGYWTPTRLARARQLKAIIAKAGQSCALPAKYRIA